MKRLAAVGLWAASWLVFAAAAGAQAPPPGDGPKLGAPGGPGGPDPGGALVERVKAALGQLGLTDAQEKQVRPILEKWAGAIKADLEKNRDQIQVLTKQLKDAMDAQDRDKAQAAREGLRKLFDPEAQVKALVNDVKSVLTDDQNKKLADAIAKLRSGPGEPPPFRPGMVAERILNNADKLGLTDDQKKKIQAALDAFRAALKGSKEDPQVFRTEGEKLMKVIHDTLTPDQLAKVRPLVQEGGPPPGAPRPEGPLALIRSIDLNLTADQEKQIGDLVKAFQEAKTTAEGRAQMHKKLLDDIRALLTPAQQEKFDKAMKERRDRPTPPPPPPPGPGAVPPPPV